MNNRSGWETTSVAAFDFTGGDPDLALDSSDRPHITFYSGHPNRYLVYVYDDGTGISGPSSPSPQATTLSISSNPFRECLDAGCSLAETAYTELLVYDIQGRLIDTLHAGLTEKGDHSASWVPGGGIPCGNYILILRTVDSYATSKVVYLN